MTGPRDAAPVEIIIVQAPGCHFCDDAHEALQGLAEQYAITLTLVDARSAQGQTLLTRHRPAMNPLVLVNGEFFSAGRLPRGKLRTLLDRSVPPLPAGPATPSGPPAVAQVG